MRFPQSANIHVGNSDNVITWKRRPSEIRGYVRTLYFTDNNGDYIRVDYNLREKRVRLYIEDNDEGGIEYYSIINNGKITVERNLTTGRSSNLQSKFSKRSAIFATIPNRQVLKLIGDNYGIASISNEGKKRNIENNLERTRRKYFVADNKNSRSTIGQFSSDKSLKFADVVDIIIGVAVTFAIFYISYNFMLSGIIAAVYGILLGIIDMFMRRREPIFLKIMLFVFCGFIAYIYGYYIF